VCFFTSAAALGICFMNLLTPKNRLKSCQKSKFSFAESNFTKFVQITFSS
jgi:hypothetical protein